LTNDGPRYVSSIGIGAGNPNTVIGQVLRSVQDTGICPI
jgi:D-alanyl-D-alanine carboxypeptidase/D-alanyl-D-alanine-endopeptidase (penicillin-binding protein 4)